MKQASILTVCTQQDFAPLQEALKECCRLVLRTSCQKALELLCARSDDYALLFLDLPEEDRRRKALLEYAELVHLPWVVSVDRDDEEGEVRAFAEGAADVLYRPYRPVSLRRRVKNVLHQTVLDTGNPLDKLTGIPEKNAFYDRVEELLSAGETGRQYTIVCLDLERFKVVNDLFGAEEGDKLLRFIGETVRFEAMSSQGVCGRIGADVFALCLPDGEGQEQEIARRLRRKICAYPIDLELVPVFGFYHVRDAALPVSSMCDWALMALNSAKGRYQDYYAVYDDTLRQKLLQEQSLVNEMRPALESGQFKVLLQPKCDISTGKVVGAEALTRWFYPGEGVISPEKFIPLFEKNGFILELDNYIWEQTCQYLRDWISAGRQAVPISVNISQADLRDPDLCGRLQGLVARYGIDPALFQLEITESVCAQDMERLQEVADTLHHCGFTILMDDFGSGYSSLNTLQKINVDILKLDMRFLQCVGSGEERGGSILESIVRMAKWLNLGVIAEGVETWEQAEFLLNIGCGYAQGYYFYRPMPMEDFSKILLDEDRMDFSGISADRENHIDFSELFRSDGMSAMILNHLIGGVGIYEYFGGRLEVLRVTDGYYRITGCTPESLRVNGRNVMSQIHPEDRQIVKASLEEAARNPLQGARAEFRRRRHGGGEGTYLWLEMHIFFLTKNGGRSIYYASLNDITERKKSQEALRTSELRLRTAMEASSLLLFDYDAGKHTVDYSFYYADYYGLPAHLEGVPHSLVEDGTIFSEDAPNYLEMYGRLASGAQQCSCEVRVRIADGSYRWNRITLIEVGGGPEEDCRAVGLVEDIQPQRDLEERLVRGQKTLMELRAENQRTALEMITDRLPGGLIGSYLEQGYPLYVVNRQMLRELRCDDYQDFMRWTGGSVRPTIHPGDLERVERSVPLDLPVGAEYNIRYRMVRRDGTSFWTADSGRVVLAEDGRRAIISVCLDISEERRREEFLRVAEERFYTLLRHSSNGLWEYDFATKSLLASPKWSKYLTKELRYDEVPESIIEAGIVSPETADDYRALYGRMVQGEREVSSIVGIRGPDGKYREKRLSYSVVPDLEGNPLKAIGIISDP